MSCLPSLKMSQSLEQAIKRAELEQKNKALARLHLLKIQDLIAKMPLQTTRPIR